MSHQKTTEVALTNAINHPLTKQKKNTDLQATIGAFSSSKAPDIDQITIAMDKFENKWIKKRKVED